MTIAAAAASCGLVISAVMALPMAGGVALAISPKKARVVSLNCTGNSWVLTAVMARDRSVMALSGRGTLEWPPGLVACIW